MKHSGDLLVTVPAPNLVRAVGAFEIPPWNTDEVSWKMVRDAIAEGRLAEENPCWSYDMWDYIPGRMHAERIAWLVVHGWDPLDEPPLLSVDEHDGVALYDGNHRVHALAYTGSEENVVVAIDGFVDGAERVLGIRIP